MIFDFGADALYFQALENGIAYAKHEEKILSPDFKTNFGLRAKIQFLLPHDCYEISVQFLHFHARTKTKKEDGEFSSLWSFSSKPLFSIDNMWRLHLGLADLFLTRTWKISPCVSLFPFWGFRYGEIRHKLHQNENVSMKNKFWGIGPQIGCRINWNLWNRFFLFGKNSVSLLYGKFYIHQDIEAVKFFDVFRQTAGIYEFALGLSLEKGNVYGQIAFEVFIFPSQNQLVRFGQLSNYAGNQGDLSLHGLSFGLGMNF